MKKLTLSKLVPVHFTSHYKQKGRKKIARWWQWRDRVFGYSVKKDN